PAHQDREDGIEEIRPHRAEARRLQGRQNQVGPAPALIGRGPCCRAVGSGLSPGWRKFPERNPVLVRGASQGPHVGLPVDRAVAAAFFGFVERFVAMPIEIVIDSSLPMPPSTAIGLSAMAARRRSATMEAIGSAVSGITTTNSSPP